MPIRIKSLFAQKKPVIGCVHLKALPGSPQYDGNNTAILAQALAEARIYQEQGVDAIIIENFGDRPFYPGEVPAITVAMMAAIGREIKLQTQLPLGINVLRNDAQAALSIAHAIDAEFIRVNIHLHAFVTDQGLIQGLAHETLRLRKALGTDIQIWADVAVKHATPLGKQTIQVEAEDLCERGLADVLIVSGVGTGKPTDKQELALVKESAHVPVVIGSGISLKNIADYYTTADGFIIGSYFKEKGLSQNALDPKRIAELITFTNQLNK